MWETKKSCSLTETWLSCSGPWRRHLSRHFQEDTTLIKITTTLSAAGHYRGALLLYVLVVSSGCPTTCIPTHIPTTDHHHLAAMHKVHSLNQKDFSSWHNILCFSCTELSQNLPKDFHFQIMEGIMSVLTRLGGESKTLIVYTDPWII